LTEDPSKRRSQSATYDEPQSVRSRRLYFRQSLGLASPNLSLTQQQHAFTCRQMNRCPLLVVGALILSGCNPLSERSSQAQFAKQSQPGQPRSALEAAWQVAEVDGRTLVGVTLQGKAGVLSWEPSCAGWFISFRQNGVAVSFKPERSSPEGARTVCLVGFPDSLPSVFGALPMLTRVEKPDANSVRLTGGGHTIRLERLQSAAERSVRSLNGRWSVSTLNGERLPEDSLVFSGTDDVITWEPACARQSRGYTIENDRIAIVRLPGAPPPLPGEKVVPPELICAIGLHLKLKSAFAVMDKATHVRLSVAGDVKIEGESHALTFTPTDE
jgi:hypothetical protein